jgi:hypothetical protein
VRDGFVDCDRCAGRHRPRPVCRGRRRTLHADATDKRGGFVVRPDTELALQQLGDDVETAQCLGPAPGPREQLNQQAMGILAEVVDRHQAHRCGDRRFDLASRCAGRCQAAQDIRCQSREPAALDGEPIIETRCDRSAIFEQFAAIQRGSLGKNVPVSRGRLSFELDSVYRDGPQRNDQGIASGEDQVVTHTAAQHQQRLAQAMPRLLRTAVCPEKIGKRLAGDRPTGLQGEQRQQRVRLAWQLMQLVPVDRERERAEQAQLVFWQSNPRFQHRRAHLPILGLREEVETNF